MPASSRDMAPMFTPGKIIGSMLVAMHPMRCRLKNGKEVQPPPGGLLLSLQSSCWQWRQALRLSRVLVDTPAPNDPSIDIHQTVMYLSCHQKLPFSLCHNSNTREHGGGEGTTTQRAMAGSGVHCQKSNTSSFLQGKIFPFLLQDIDKRLM